MALAEKPKEAKAEAPEPAAKLSASERIETLLDPGSLRTFRSRVVGTGKRVCPGDGVVAGQGTVDGRPVFCYSQDETFAGGSLGAVHAESIIRTLELAGRSRAPVVAFVASGGARVDDGMAALGGYARIFHKTIQLFGEVPQISVVTGVSAGGGAYEPALTDLVVMCREAAMFLTGPGIVKEVMGEDVDIHGLGGPKVHERSGVCQYVAEDDSAAALAARDMLGYLPSRAGENPPSALSSVPPPPGDPSEVVPEESRKVYDVREVARKIFDGGELLELNARWARNMVTALARLEGRPVGVIANQPYFLGGVIDVAGSQKGSRFVDFCDRWNLPLVVLVDTPGFLPGTRQEKAGVICHGAALLRSFGQARVPKVTVVLRKAYGGAYIVMNSKGLGSDHVLAWPSAQIGIMGAPQAAALLHRKELKEADDFETDRMRLAEEYAAEHMTAEKLAEIGWIDEIVDPQETRPYLATVMHGLAGGTS